MFRIAPLLVLLAGFAYADPARLTQSGTALTLSSGQLSTTFDTATGQWSARSADGTAAADSLRCTVTLQDSTFSTAAPAQRFSHTPFRDAFGPGQRLEIDYAAPRPFTLLLTLHDDSPALLVQLRLNRARGLRLRELTLPEGHLRVGRDASNLCALVNYWSGQWYSEIHPVDLTEHQPRWETYSHFYLAACNRADRRSAILGALYSQGATRIEAAIDAAKDPNRLLFKTRNTFEKSPLSIATDTYESAPHILALPSNVFDGLETYGQLAKAYRPMPLPPRPPTGWCSWDAGASSSQKEFFANVDALKANRLDEYGLKIVQLDDGWQQGERCSGIWRPRLDRFPAGMKGVADYVRSRGFDPGLWIGPFGEDGSNRGHPEFYAAPNTKGYDLSSPAFQKYLADEMSLYVNDWGFHYIKADFLSCGATASNQIPFDESYRACVEIMRRAAHAQANGYLMTCINHEWLTVGRADGQRLGNDVQGGAFVGLYPALRNWPRRYFTNNTFWVGDPDMLHVNLPTDEEARAWASFVALSGGATLSGDSIPRLSPARIEILKKALPAQGITARPVDLFERPTGWAPKFPRIWHARIHRENVGDWHVLGLFNWTTRAGNAQNGNSWPTYAAERQGVKVDLARDLALDPDRTYLAYDFWAGKELEPVQGTLSRTLPASSCQVIVLREEQPDRPQILATDRHILSGSEDLRSVSWDPQTRTLSGLIQTVKQIPVTLAVHIPPTFQLKSASSNNQPATVALVIAGSAHVTVTTDADGNARWMLRFDALPAPPKPEKGNRVSTITHGPSYLYPADASSRDVRRLCFLHPLWTDQRHDVEGGPPAGEGWTHIGTIAPYWVCYDVAPYSRNYPRFTSKVTCTGGRVFFEVLGDDQRLFASPVLKQGESAPIDIPIQGVKRLTLICHAVDGWFSSTRGTWEDPSLRIPH